MKAFAYLVFLATLVYLVGFVENLCPRLVAHVHPALRDLAADPDRRVAIPNGRAPRDLVRTFGDEYLDYRRRVPALLPWPRP